MRAALLPFVNEFEAWMPSETRCVRALCAKRCAMARVWVGQEGGRGRAGAATTRARVMCGFSKMMMFIESYHLNSAFSVFKLGICLL